MGGSRLIVVLLLALGLFSIVESVATTKNISTNVFAGDEGYENSDDSNDDEEPPIVRVDHNILLDRKPKNPFQKRIIGGQNVGGQRYPYMVSIFPNGDTDNTPPACGGTLIGKR